MSNLVFVVNELLSWRAVLDIGLLAAGIFFLYRILVRLGTWKILGGIVAAFLIFFVAGLLDLQGTSWIFQNVSNVAVVGLIVIFQPELRKLFEKVVSLHGKNLEPPSELLTTTVSECLWKLAQQRRGALIVYPGKEPIAESLSGGHIINAEASVPLLLSIFDPNSPGHDGALVIGKNRLSQFGVRLPMSQSSRLGEEYGTRHHAAMGLVEKTDALVLVVSEERGVVSAFRDGRMTPLKSQDEIAASISDYHQKIAPEKMGLHNIDRRQYVQAAISLTAAAVFWTALILTNKQVVERTAGLPIEYLAAPEGLILIENKQEEIKVRITGPKSEVNDYLLSQPSVKIDLSKTGEGRQTLLVTDESINLPEKVMLREKSPAQIDIVMARMTVQKMKIKPQLVGSLPPGLKLRTVTVIPEEMRVLSPQTSKGKKVASLLTTPVYLNSINTTSQIFCKIIADSTIQPLDKPWSDVEVLLEIEPAEKSK